MAAYPYQHEKIISEIEKIFQWRRDRQEAWAKENWRGKDPNEISRELDAEAFQRICKLFS